jgi:hypothetical protein
MQKASSLQKGLFVLYLILLKNEKRPDFFCIVIAVLR